jgi:biopolymer transport protein ExbB/TolQ
MTAILKTFIYLVSSSLFVPVLLALALLVVWALVYAGQFFRTWLTRRRLMDPGEDLPEMILSGGFETCLPGKVVRVIRRLEALNSRGGQVLVVNLLRDAELSMWRSLDKLKIMIRLGPGLGLIGTLIPMGTGLASLGQGDLAQLSQELVVAFTTTVVGMALGLGAYVLFTVQRRWVEADVKSLELAAELLCTDTTDIASEKAA